MKWPPLPISLSLAALTGVIVYQTMANGAAGRPLPSLQQAVGMSPVCLRTMQLGTGFELLSRDKDRLKFYETQALPPEVEWVRRHVEKLSQTK